MQDFSLFLQYLNLSWLFKKSQRSDDQISESEREDDYYDGQIIRYAKVVKDYSTNQDGQTTSLINNTKALIWSIVPKRVTLGCWNSGNNNDKYESELEEDKETRPPSLFK